MKSVVVDPTAYNWEGDNPLKDRFSQTIIYDMHVLGFTCHPSSLQQDTRGK
jgi:glycogen operon protein